MARLRPRADAPTIDAKASSRLTVLGVPIDRLPGDSMLRRIGDAAENRRGVVVSYVNAHSLNLACRDPAYRRVLTASDFVLNDGIGLQIAAIVQRRPFRENLNGSDFTLRILEMAAARGWSVFVLGARRGVAAQAADRLKERIPDLRIAGTADGFGDLPDATGAIRDSKAHVVVVALGNPAQELWLDRHLGETGARVGVGVGAFLDFVTDTVPRAPAWMNRAGIEWLFRLIQEPKRLWRRYVIGNPQFLARVVAERARGRRR